MRPVSWGLLEGEGPQPLPHLGDESRPGARWTGARRWAKSMHQTVRFQETLRRLAIFDEGFVEAGFGLGLASTAALEAKTAALLQVAVSVAIGSSPVCLQWSAARALAADATKDEIVDVLLAIVPVAGLGRVVSAAPGVAAALEYDIDAALEDPDGRIAAN